MRRWIDEGRVGGQSLVWREGWPQWQRAADVFQRQLGPAAEAPVGRPQVVEPIGGLVDRARSDRDAGLAATARPGARGGGRRRRRGSRAMAAVIILGLASVALLVTLIYVLQG